MKLDTCTVERKKGQHLQREERGAIQHLKNAGYTNRAIARAIGCSPTTVGNELKRGTPPRKSSKGRKPGYSARRGEAAYKANRKRFRKHTESVTVLASFAGYWNRSKNTSGLWMPASAMLVCTDCFQQRRWSAPTRFTMRSGQAILTCLWQNCPKP